LLSYELENNLSATLPAFSTRFGGALTVVGEVPAALLTALPAGFGGTLWIIREISTTLMATLASRFGGKVAIPRETALLVRNAFAAFARDFLLLHRIHRRKSAVRGSCTLVSHRDSPQSTTDAALTAPVRSGSRKKLIFIMFEQNALAPRSNDNKLMPRLAF
jgi:hypothetical protein